MRSLIRSFVRLSCNLSGSRSGATVIEYALIGGLIAIAIVSGAMQLGSATNDSFVAASDGFN